VHYGAMAANSLLLILYSNTRFPLKTIFGVFIGKKMRCLLYALSSIDRHNAAVQYNKLNGMTEFEK